MVLALDIYKIHVFLFLGNEQLCGLLVEVLANSFFSVAKHWKPVAHMATPSTAVFRQLKTNTEHKCYVANNLIP